MQGLGTHQHALRNLRVDSLTVQITQNAALPVFSIPSGASSGTLGVSTASEGTCTKSVYVSHATRTWALRTVLAEYVIYDGPCGGDTIESLQLLPA
jgi:hypothetical protein